VCDGPDEDSVGPEVPDPTDALAAVQLPEGEKLSAEVGAWLEANPDRHWADYIDTVAKAIAQAKEGRE
jgi:hypothetical protein